ncbi:protein-disulfide reductase DsbD domain-containing protein [Pelagicoccus sp. SDUM812002]|uniref:protein-disulfide reductase DsbD family protein n=1 Tax=Pelagicoccus sp. SDUM812002 TaxID=3041266 RepID=UPI00280F088D|nr:protein-disulfide reductase DsbD domain-containing protein [Pelagicoccus sp. SDUM812002]MDQ8188198.1 protein-disulfide reductase DsbD family protein [Pelagicoccus sp. SDUM812002]
MNVFLRVKLLLLAALCCCGTLSAQSDYNLGPVDTGEVEAELVADVTAIRPGQEFQLALRLKMDPHWHVYWINPGDVGFMPEVQWELPDGFEVGPFEFPTPERIPFEPLVSYGYEGEIFLIAKARAPESLEAGTVVRINAASNWLVCEEACIPGNADLALELPVTESGASLSPAEYADEIAETRAALPVDAAGGEIAVEDLGDTLVFNLRWDGLEGAELKDPYFYVEQESVSDSAKEQSFDLAGDTLRVAVPKTEYFEAVESGYTGLLYSENGFEAAGGVNAVRFHVQGELAAMGIAAPVAAAGSAFDIGLGEALLYAFLGGMILNLMPCVFPVLSIKVLGFVQQSGEDKGKVLKHGLAFTVGVLASFWVLAGTLIALRSAGEGLGWGFQLQQPEFVVVMLVVMFLFGLSMAGVFEMGTSAISLQGKVKGNGLGGSFFSGVIATAVATPCTGPFMGQALGYALTLSAFQSLTVFTFLALGMATPYLVLSANPALINKLPRPGAWMETFKQVMSFPMFATCIWLIWLLGGHVGNDGLPFVLGGLLVVALGAWIYGRWSTPMRKKATQRFASVLAVLTVLGGIWMMMPREQVEGEEEIAWQSYSPALVDELSGSGKPVFVDFTADWCLTCKANELRLFRSEEVLQEIKNRDVQLVQGDWTKKDAVITQALAKYGRSSVPLYLLYDGKPGSEPKVLPQVLSPDTFLKSLDEI